MRDEIILPEGYTPGEDIFAPAFSEEEAQDTPAQEPQKEDEILVQNRTAAAMAPVRGVTGGGSTGGKSEKTLFEQGFDAASGW